MADDVNIQDPAYLRPRGLYWRSVAALLVFQAVGWAVAAVLAYLIVSPELAKDYFSAHRTVKDASRLVVPALAISAGVGFLLVGAGSAFSVGSHSRRLLEPLRQLDRLVRALGTGKLPAAGPDAKGSVVAGEIAAALVPLRAREQDLQRIAREIQKLSLELNYRSAGTGQVTLKDLRALSSRLDELCRDLSRSCVWFEG